MSETREALLEGIAGELRLLLPRHWHVHRQPPYYQLTIRYKARSAAAMVCVSHRRLTVVGWSSGQADWRKWIELEYEDPGSIDGAMRAVCEFAGLVPTPPR